MSTVPKLLLLVFGAPESSGTGEIFLSQIARNYPDGRLIRFSLMSDTAHQLSASWHGASSITHRTQASTVPIVSSLLDSRFRLLSSRKLVGEIRKLVETHKIDLIWSVLNNNLIVALTRQLMNAIPLPFVSTMWDAPEHFAMSHHLDPLTRQVLLRDYATVLQRSRRVSVVSESTRDIYLRRYGIRGVILRQGLRADPHVWSVESARGPSARDPFAIGFAGSLYAKKEWNSLLKAIESVKGSLSGRSVAVKFIGRFPRTFTDSAPFVETLGRHSQSETLGLLSRMDVAYLPYWFDQKYSYTVKTSFPSKLSAYLAAGIPIFYHGPEDSSPTRFLNDFPVGLCCHSRKTSDILATLEQFITDDEFQSKFAKARHSALEEALSPEVMLTQFATLLGIDRSQLGCVQ